MEIIPEVTRETERNNMQLKSKDMHSFSENLKDLKICFHLYHKNPQLAHYTLLYLKNEDYIIELPQINLVQLETITAEMCKIDILVKISIRNSITNLPKWLLIYLLSAYKILSCLID